MGWLIKLGDGAKSDLAKIDKAIALRITKFLRERLATLDNLRSVGKPLKGSQLGDCWALSRRRLSRYRKH
ncbi:MAG: type II toxin-antitoxin system RelE/ParE family toxin [Helicobacteraceae bacterium]|nr:type II toxin-antitoxin system RelE/ParE family toxin [Helicobacteraceae bacterium]